MKSHRRVQITLTLLLAALFSGSLLALRGAKAARGPAPPRPEALYLASAETLRTLSLGYSGLLADIYWTRAVQYFGRKHLENATSYELLYPLLEIATDLDPHLTEAYQTGALFLSQKPPAGAGEPDRAAALLEKGIRANPTQWRLYFTLGFVNYLDRHDYKAAEEAFERGSKVPGALPWMKVMAARMAEHGDDISTGIQLWRAVYETNADKRVRDTALTHIASLQAETDLEELEKRAQIYRQRTGAWPASWADMVRGGLLTDIPTDPTGEPYTLKPGGSVSVKNPRKFPFLDQRFIH